MNLTITVQAKTNKQFCNEIQNEKLITEITCKLYCNLNKQFLLGDSNKQTKHKMQEFQRLWWWLNKFFICENRADQGVYYNKVFEASMWKSIFINWEIYSI